MLEFPNRVTFSDTFRRRQRKATLRRFGLALAGLLVLALVLLGSVSPRGDIGYARCAREGHVALGCALRARWDAVVAWWST